MTDAELEKLAENIKKHGLQEQVAIRRDDETNICLLDGRNRLDALQLLGREIFNDYNFKSVDLDIDPIAYVISKNIHRRHLNTAQKREVLAALLKADPEKSDRRIAKEIGVDHKTIGKARRRLEDVGTIPHAKTRTDTTGRKQPAVKKPKATATAPVPVDDNPATSAEKRKVENVALDALGESVEGDASGRDEGDLQAYVDLLPEYEQLGRRLDALVKDHPLPIADVRKFFESKNKLRNDRGWNPWSDAVFILEDSYMDRAALHRGTRPTVSIDWHGRRRSRR
jgi:hypothetical protein